MPSGALLVDEPQDQRWRGSSSPAKKIEAALRISLAPLKSRFSLLKRLNSSNSASVNPGRRPASIWAGESTCATSRPLVLHPIERHAHGTVVNLWGTFLGHERILLKKENGTLTGTVQTERTTVIITPLNNSPRIKRCLTLVLDMANSSSFPTAAGEVSMLRSIGKTCSVAYD